jgi:hypothetical protein
MGTLGTSANPESQPTENGGSNRRVPGIATQAAVSAGKGLCDSAPTEHFRLRLSIRRVPRNAGNNPGHVPALLGKNP